MELTTKKEKALSSPSKITQQLQLFHNVSTFDPKKFKQEADFLWSALTRKGTVNSKNLSILGVCEKYTKGGIMAEKILNKHKVPVAKFVIALMNHHGDKSSDQFGNKPDDYKNLAILLTFMKQFLLHYRNMRQQSVQVKDVVKLEKKLIINKKGALIPDFLKVFDGSFLVENKKDKTFEEQINDIVQLIDGHLRNGISYNQAYQLNHDENLRVELASELLLHVMEKKEQQFHTAKKIEESLDLAKTLIMPPSPITSTYYIQLINSLLRGIYTSRQHGKTEEAMSLEIKLMNQIDKIVQEVVIEQRSEIKFSDKEKREIFSLICNSTIISPKTIDLLNSLEAPDEQTMLADKLEFLKNVFSPQTKINSQKVDLKAYFYLHSKQITATIELISRNLAKLANGEAVLKQLSTYAYLLNAYVLDYCTENNKDPQLSQLADPKVIVQTTLDQQLINQMYQGKQTLLNMNDVYAKLEDAKYKKHAEAIGERIKVIKNKLNERVLIGLDYQSIYQIAYVVSLNKVLRSSEDKPTEQDNLLKFLFNIAFKHIMQSKTFLPFIEKINKVKYDLDNPDGKIAFCRALIDEVQQHYGAFLPKQWFDTGSVNMFNKFPPATNGYAPVFDDWSANYQCDGKFIALQGPVDALKNNTYKFFKILLETKAFGVLSLGKDYQIYWQDLDNEQHFGSGENKITVKVFATEAGRKLKITNAAKQSHECFVFNLSIADNQPFQLDAENARTFVDINNNIPPNSPLAVHCASGVGRTGFGLIEFSLLDQLKMDKRFREFIEKFASSGELTSDDENYLLEKMVKIINELRQSRYMLQTDTQLTAIAPQFIILAATELNLAPAYVDVLAKQLRVGDFTNQFSLSYKPQATLEQQLKRDKVTFGNLVETGFVVDNSKTGQQSQGEVTSTLTKSLQ